MKSIAIVGAGITGLTAGYVLKKRGVPVTVYEAGNTPGGVIRTVRENGFLAECGPNTLLETSPEIPALFRELGLQDEALYSDPAASKKYIIRNGRPVEVPGSPLRFVTTELFSTSAKVRLLREPFLPRSAPDQEESLAQFVVRRLGREFLDYAINPFVAGVYAGDPWKLSVREAFGKVYALEQKYGSLIRGQILGARERKKRGTVSKQNAPKVSFLNGLSTLTETLGEQLDVELRFGHALQRIEQINGGWRLELKTEAGVELEDHPAVLLTLPAYKLHSLPLASRSGASFEFLEQIRYAPVSSLVLGFKRKQVEHPLDGFGFLVPEVENFSILGAIFSSSLFPKRAPKGHVCISCYLGGLRSPETAFRLKDEQVTLAVADLNRALGIKGRPVFTHNVVFPKAIPQYELGYTKIAARIAGLEQSCPGLLLGGNYYKGVSLGDSILNGLAYGEQLAREHSPILNFEHHLAAA